MLRALRHTWLGPAILLATGCGEPHGRLAGSGRAGPAGRAAGPPASVACGDGDACPWERPPSVDAAVTIVADDDGSGSGATDECREANNAHRMLAPGCAAIE